MNRNCDPIQLAFYFRTSFDVVLSLLSPDAKPARSASVKEGDPHNCQASQSIPGNIIYLGMTTVFQVHDV